MREPKSSLSDHWHMDSEPFLVKANTDKPQPSSLSEKEIEVLASDCAKKLSYDFKGDPSPCVRRAGGEIRYTDFWAFHQAEKGSIYIQGREAFVIWLSERASKRMNAFTIAHELGHYFVHYLPINSGRFMIAARYDEGDVENEANLFALNFLAPKFKIRELIKKGQTLESISIDLCVDAYLLRRQIETV